MINSDNFADFLKTAIPGVSAFLDAYEEDVEMALSSNPYGVMSEVFWWKIFEPALKLGDGEMISRCFAVTEALLSEGTEFMRECAIIRVIPYLAGFEATQHLAGPATLSVLSS
ncbi:hypothetical protein GCM10027589_00340 [Actinocorallia lasiicapitis]